ncbi:amino acid racemase [Enterococcus saccharolyticus]|uniref:aspartate/glutamate racemase family protein n=1 Tax=Enterococcus TaxID=1350 RepID=UPI001E3BF16A|nr:amino acid racemase [Enterococcus saccharolyticus]MCD5000992.1 amino acid racemase [Enterococcus saccharolyticus]
MKNFFAILGGMGTLATEAFVQLLNERTPNHSDQDYLNYLLINHATVPDRTAFILGKSNENPATKLKEDLIQYTPLQPNFFVLTCNTAHHFYDELTSVTSVPILHMPRLAVKAILAKFGRDDRPVRVGVLATEGTIQSKVYEKELLAHQEIDVVIPPMEIQTQVTNLIYRDIKENNFLNEELYFSILEKMIKEHACDVLLLGCTELSLMEEVAKQTLYPVVDAQSELVDETIRLALEARD